MAGSRPISRATSAREGLPCPVLPWRVAVQVLPVLQNSDKDSVDHCVGDGRECYATCSLQHKGADHYDDHLGSECCSKRRGLEFRVYIYICIENVYVYIYIYIYTYIIYIYICIVMLQQTWGGCGKQSSLSQEPSRDHEAQIQHRRHQHQSPARVCEDRRSGSEPPEEGVGCSRVVHRLEQKIRIFFKLVKVAHVLVRDTGTQVEKPVEHLGLAVLCSTNAPWLRDARSGPC